MRHWNYAKSVPDKVYVACSGGMDSVAVASILAKWKDVTLCHFSHKDHAHKEEQASVSSLAEMLNIPVIFEYSSEDLPTSNKEELWRNDRYRWFHTLDAPVVTGHTLDDAVEWYMMTCLRGRGEFMPYQNKNVIRPFLLTRKDELRDYAVDSGLKWWEDETNHDENFGTRAKVRKFLLPASLVVESGLYNIVKKRLTEKIKNEQ